MAVGEYHTSTSVESSAATPSTGRSPETPVSTAACCQGAAVSVPSTATVASMRGARAASAPARPLYTVGLECAMAAATAATWRRMSIGGETSGLASCRATRKPPAATMGSRTGRYVTGAADPLLPLLDSVGMHAQYWSPERK